MEELQDTQPRVAPRFNDVELDHEIAVAVAPHIDEALKLREQHTKLLPEDPDGDYLVLDETVSKYLSISHLSDQSIPNHVVVESLENRIENLIDTANEYVDGIEDSHYTDKEVELINSPDWTEEETKEYANCSLEEWNEMPVEERVDALRDFSRDHQFIKGLINTFPWGDYQRHHYPEDISIMNIDVFLGQQTLTDKPSS